MKRLVFAAIALCACTDTDTDADSFEPWTLDDLSPSEGLSIRTPVFEVPQGTEVQDCYFFQVPDTGDGQPLWIDRSIAAINPGSHHMNLFRVKTIVELDPADGRPVELGTADAPLAGLLVEGRDPATDPCFKSANWADWPLVVNSQNSSLDNPYTDWRLPDGVAQQLAPGEMLMLQTHYVNASSQETPQQGKVGVNLYRTAEEAPIELGTLFATQQSIRICQSTPEVSYSGTCRFPEGTLEVAAANGHFHSRGTRFQIFAWDGVTTSEPAAADRFYLSDTWDDPPMTTFESGLALPDAGGIYWTCDYRWTPPPVGCDVVDARDPEGQGDCCYTFGPLVEASEHCNVFLYYWPRVDRADIFCN